MLFRFRDSLNLLPGALRDLAKSLCPALGPKGSLNYNEVSESNLLINKDKYLDYMKQDILSFIRWCDAKSTGDLLESLQRGHRDKNHTVLTGSNYLSYEILR